MRLHRALPPVGHTRTRPGARTSGLDAGYGQEQFPGGGPL